MSESVLQVTGLSHAYAGKAVLSEVSLTVESGHLTAVLGSSGVGKTTLMRAIAGFVTPDAGEITLHGKAMVSGGRELVSAEARGVGMVFQDHALFPFMTTAENVAFGLDSWTADARHARVNELLSLVGLEDKADASPGTLSGGQRQRVALARALAPRPNILLLDEPFASLDAELRRDLADELRALLQREQVAALLVTHDHRAALAWSDQMVILGADIKEGPGRVHQHDSPEQLYRRPATETVARLTGEVITLEADARGATATHALGEVTLMAPHQGAVRLMLRPEQLRFHDDPQGDARVTRRAFEGALVRLSVESPVGTFSIEVSAHDAPELDTRGRVSINDAVWALPVP